jgi:hypothetical protein
MPRTSPAALPAARFPGFSTWPVDVHTERTDPFPGDASALIPCQVKDAKFAIPTNPLSMCLTPFAQHRAISKLVRKTHQGERFKCTLR